MAKVSVVIPLYNREHYIVKTLKSIEGQQLAPYEVIVVDDASTDNSARIVRAYSTQIKLNLQVIPNDRGKGCSGAMNTGIKRSTGDFIAILDSDDLWEPGHLKQLVEALTKYPQAAMAFSAFEIFGHAKDVEEKKWAFKTSIKKCMDIAFEEKEAGVFLSNKDLCYAIFHVGFPFRCQASIIRRDFFTKNDLFFDEDITYTLDSQFVTIASYHAAFIFVKDVGARIRRHEENDGDRNYGEQIEDSYEIRVLKLKQYFKDKTLTLNEKKAFKKLLWGLQEEVLKRRSKKGGFVINFIESIKLLQRVPGILSVKSVIKLLLRRLQ